jgi:hypothetical protein
MIKKFLVLYGNQRFITALLTKAVTGPYSEATESVHAL